MILTTMSLWMCAQSLSCHDIIACQGSLAQYLRQDDRKRLCNHMQDASAEGRLGGAAATKERGR